jgi:hypothetical protein
VGNRTRAHGDESNPLKIAAEYFASLFCCFLYLNPLTVFTVKFAAEYFESILWCFIYLNPLTLFIVKIAANSFESILYCFRLPDSLVYHSNM